MQFLLLLYVVCAVTSQVEIIMELLAVMAVLAFSNEAFDEVHFILASVSAHAINLFMILLSNSQQRQMTAKSIKHVVIGVHVVDFKSASQWE